MRLTINIILICLIAALVSPSVSRGDDDAVHKVLILHSYHHGFQWTDDVMKGIDAVFRGSEMNVQMTVEYMDTKRHDPVEYFPLLYELYKKRYEKERIDLIIVSDNNALEFLLMHRDVLFPGVPVVFCGINNFNDEIIEGLAGITGVSEELSIQETINLARLLNPRLKQIAVVNDRTRTGIHNQMMLEEAVGNLKDEIGFVHFIDLTFDELQERLKGLHPDTAVLLFTFFRDREGRLSSRDEFVKAVTRSASVPAYSFWKQQMGLGVTGGVVVDGNVHGMRAAEIGLKILLGAPPESIPVMKESPNVLMLDYAQLTRFQIDRSLVPNGAVLLNRPPSFYEDHRDIIWITAGGAFLLFVLMSGFIRIRAQRKIENINVQLTEEIRERRRVEQSLRQSEDRYNALVSNIPSVTWISDEQGGTTFISSNIEKIYGYNQEEIYSGGKDLWFGRIHPDDVQRVRSDYQNLLKQNKPFDMEYRIQRKDGQWIWIHDTAVSILESDKGRHAYGVFSDITERKNIESRLKEETRLREVLLDNLPCIAMILKKGTREIVASNEVARKFGAEPGRTCYETCAQGTEPCSFCLAPQVWNNYTMVNREVQHRDRWYDGYWLPFSDELYVHYIFDITERKRSEEGLKKSNELIRSIKDVQGTFIGNRDHGQVFESLLDTLISISESEYGFLDEVLRDDSGRWYKRSLSLSNIAWDEDSLNLYKKLKKSNFEFHNLNNLAGEPVQSRNLVISNDPSHDPRSGGLPAGHPQINSFMGIPLYFGKDLVGVAGVANRKGGYTEEVALSLEPFITTCAGIISAIRSERSEQEYIARIKASLREKEVLLREVHHRVKNNFQIINSLLRLQAENIREEKLKDIFIDIGNRIRSMAMVHEMLYNESDLSKIDITGYINALTQALYRSYRIDSEKVKIRTKLEGVKMGIDVAVPFGLIVNELVSNAMKYAFPGERKGEITLSFHSLRGGKEYELIAGDNGIGLPEGLDIRKAETLGLRLVVNITEKQIGGVVDVSCDGGTEFRIRFPAVLERDMDRVGSKK